MGRVILDCRDAYRAILARRWSAAGAVAVLSIGIGLGGVVFVLADSVLWRPLPYDDADSLIVIRIASAPDLSRGTWGSTGRLPSLAEWQSRADLFTAVAAYGNSDRVRIHADGTTSLLLLRTVSPNFLSVLRPTGLSSTSSMLSPAIEGIRPLAMTAAPPGGFANLPAPGAILNAEDGRVFQVVVRLPKEFIFPVATASQRPSALIPTNFEEVASARPTGQTLTLVARLRAGVLPSMVQSQLTPSVAAAGFRLQVQSIRAYLTGSLRTLAFAAFACGLLIILVCAANFLGLVVIRSSYRAQEFAIRRALGASGHDLFRLITFEISLLGIVAIILSMGLAKLALMSIGQLIPDSYILLGAPVLSWRATGFAACAVLVVIVACSAPTWASVLASSASMTYRAAVELGIVRSIRFLLTVGQTAVAMVLLIGAAFLLRSYQALWAQETGYASDARVISVSYSPSLDTRQLVDTVGATMISLQNVPGVRIASAGTFVGAVLDKYDGAGGRRITAGDRSILLMPSEVADGYFEVSGTRLLAGRFLDSRDRGWEAVLVNRALANRLWPGQPAIDVVGMPIVGDGRNGTVVGVVQDTLDRTLDQPPPPRLFKPMESVHLGRVSYVYQPSQRVDPAAGVRKAVLDVDRTALIAGIDSISGRLAETVRDRTFSTLVLIIFASAGLGVTATGVYSLVAFVATRRRREIAIRMALGANRWHVIVLVVRGAVIAGGCGALIGLAVGSVAVNLLRSQLFGVQAGDPMTLVWAIVVLVAFTAIAAWRPTAQALRVDPNVNLRES